jgi:predicted acyl esterase
MKLLYPSVDPVGHRDQACGLRKQSARVELGRRALHALDGGDAHQVGAKRTRLLFDFPIDLHAADHRFLKGHRIMVQVQSTWFPLIDRNPQTFVENIFLAKASDYRPATHHVFRSQAHPSHIVLPVRVR